MLGDEERALAILRRSAHDYPAFAVTRKGLGQLERARGEPEAALRSFLASADVYPFDAEVQGALAELYQELGDGQAANRHARYRRILLFGGEELTTE